MTAVILRPKPAAQQEPKLPDQIADAWAAVLIDNHHRLNSSGSMPIPTSWLPPGGSILIMAVPLAISVRHTKPRASELGWA